ncbi:7-cyano-7-deazaguanine synthase [Brevundimonas sp. Leaf280]|uniref:7-cyano-7-deazaguanine synthase n=1 Tax=Brevundimonas sp. Leaf280 TaxID=1736320 RepID=UPI0009EA5363
MIGDNHVQHIVLLSGGLDSAAALAFVRDSGFPIQPLFVDYGQAARAQERSAAEAVAAHYERSLGLITVAHSRSLTSGEVVGRNGFLISAAACLTGYGRAVIVTGIHAGTPYYDCSEPFLVSMSRLLEEQSDGAIRLLNPFASWMKNEVIDYAAKAGVPISLTYSCERGSVPPCGTCASCRDRQP